MNPYLNGIMALSQLTPDQFDTGMQMQLNRAKP